MNLQDRGAVIPEAFEPGPLERRHARSQAFRRAQDTSRLSPTHWYIAGSAALGWAFDGVDVTIFGLVTPQLLKEFGLPLSDLRTAIQIFGLTSVIGYLVWPWLADRFGRRTVLSINVAMFSLAMPLAGAAPSWFYFVLVYAFVRFTLSGEWAVGAPLIIETWPTRLRGLVLGATRSAFTLGAGLAGLLTTYVVARFGWRVAFYIPGLVAILAVLIRFLVPESPEWVRGQDRMTRIRHALAERITLRPGDQAWYQKASQPGLTQLFLSDVRRNTLIVTVVYTGVLMAFTTVLQFMPLYLSETHKWSVEQYGMFFTWRGLISVPGPWIAGGLSDRYGRRPIICLALVATAVLMTIWAYCSDYLTLWVLGIAWTFFYGGAFGPVSSYISELYPTRVRSLGTGFTLAVSTFISSVLWPYVLVWGREATGTFSICFVLSAAAMLVVAVVVWAFGPESAQLDVESLGT